MFRRLGRDRNGTATQVDTPALPPPEPAPNYELALEEARREFDGLAAELSRIRDRTGQVLTIGGLAASVMGFAIPEAGGPSLLGWIVIGSFGALVLLSTFIYWPQNFHTSVDPAKLVNWVEVDQLTVPRAQRNLALFYGMKYDDNHKVIRNLTWMYRVSMIILLVELAALFINLRGP